MPGRRYECHHRGFSVSIHAYNHINARRTSQDQRQGLRRTEYRKYQRRVFGKERRDRDCTIKNVLIDKETAKYFLAVSL